MLRDMPCDSDAGPGVDPRAIGWRFAQAGEWASAWALTLDRTDAANALLNMIKLIQVKCGNSSSVPVGTSDAFASNVPAPGDRRFRLAARGRARNARLRCSSSAANTPPLRHFPRLWPSATGDTVTVTVTAKVTPRRGRAPTSREASPGTRTPAPQRTPAAYPAHPAPAKPPRAPRACEGEGGRGRSSWSARRGWQPSRT